MAPTVPALYTMIRKFSRWAVKREREQKKESEREERNVS